MAGGVLYGLLYVFVCHHISSMSTSRTIFASLYIYAYMIIYVLYIYYTYVLHWHHTHIYLKVYLYIYLYMYICNMHMLFSYTSIHIMFPDVINLYPPWPGPWQSIWLEARCALKSCEIQWGSGLMSMDVTGYEWILRDLKEHYIRDVNGKSMYVNVYNIYIYMTGCCWMLMDVNRKAKVWQRFGLIFFGWNMCCGFWASISNLQTPPYPLIV